MASPATLVLSSQDCSLGKHPDRSSTLDHRRTRDPASFSDSRTQVTQATGCATNTRNTAHVQADDPLQPLVEPWPVRRILHFTPTLPPTLHTRFLSTHHLLLVLALDDGRSTIDRKDELSATPAAATLYHPLTKHTECPQLCAMQQAGIPHSQP